MELQSVPSTSYYRTDDDDDGELSVHPQATYRHWGAQLFRDLRIALCSPLCALCILSMFEVL
jgi:hypothetical protein